MKKTELEIWSTIGRGCTMLAVFMAVNANGEGLPEATNKATALAKQDEHGEDDGHGHAKKPTTTEEFESTMCEHDVPTYQCDECRYEVGVVKLDASLMKRGDGGGLVQTQTVSRTPMATALHVTGEVSLNENQAVHISPRVSGIINTVAMDMGASVKAGETLLTLDSVELGRALADYERNQALCELSEKTFRRETSLLEQKVGSEQDVIEAQMTFEQHRTDLKASEQMLHVFGVTDQDLADVQALSHGVRGGLLSVRAPIAGTIIEKHAVAGEMAETGKDLMLLADLSTVWVWANIHSRDLSSVLDAEKDGVDVEITVAAFPGRTFKGRLDNVGATMDEKTRTVKVRATIDNSTLELRPGMFCDVAISLSNGKAEEVVAVPRAAVLSDEGLFFVFKHLKDDFFVRQAVRKGREFFGKVEILEGLDAGETIVSEGSFLLKSDVLREKMGAGCAD